MACLPANHIIFYKTKNSNITPRIVSEFLMEVNPLSFPTISAAKRVTRRGMVRVNGEMCDTKMVECLFLYVQFITDRMQ